LGTNRPKPQLNVSEVSEQFTQARSPFTIVGSMHTFPSSSVDGCISGGSPQFGSNTQQPFGGGPGVGVGSAGSAHPPDTSPPATKRTNGQPSSGPSCSQPACVKSGAREPSTHTVPSDSTGTPAPPSGQLDSNTQQPSGTGVGVGGAVGVGGGGGS